LREDFELAKASMNGFEIRFYKDVAHMALFWKTQSL